MRFPVKSLIDDRIEPSAYGNKASGLSWLYKHGFEVPPAVFVPFNLDYSSNSTELLNEIERHLGNVDSNNVLIVRSSSTFEDAQTESGAGQFVSIANIRSREGLLNGLKHVRRAVSESVDIDGAAIVQVQVRPALAGVLFPTDPVSASKSKSHIELVAGYAGPLLGGIETGTLWEVSDQTVNRIHGDVEVSPELLYKLRSVGKKIEQLQGRPCDIEFAIDDEDRLWLLQVRPVVSGISSHASLEPVGQKQDEANVDDKIRLRLIARELDVPISRAWTLQINSEPSKDDLNIVSKVLLPDQMYSYVVIDPHLIDGKVLRQFSYGREAVERLKDVLSIVARFYWKCVIIIKEVLHARYTGLAMRDAEGYWIEIAQGHYVPKGFVEVSRFRFDLSGNLIGKEITVQQDSYEVNPLGATRETVARAVEIDEALLQKALKVFTRVWEKINCVLEFGITPEDMVFLVDYVPATPKLEIPLSMVRSGVVSRGRASGRLVRIDNELHARRSQDWHAKNLVVQETTTDTGEGLIIAARRPFISLMEYIGSSARGKLGFVFEEATLLSHLAIQLRERGIPAIWCESAKVNNYIDRLVELDAETPETSREERLTLTRLKDS